MVGFNQVKNCRKWLDFSVKNNLKTLLYATRAFLSLLYLGLVGMKLKNHTPIIRIEAFRNIDSKGKLTKN